MNIQNQCQGCQAGWEKFTHNPWTSGSKGIDMHRVEGGYKGEIVICTAYRYKESKPNERKKTKRNPIQARQDDSFKR